MTSFIKGSITMKGVNGKRCCAVFGCKNKAQGKVLSFHGFPSVPEKRRRLWIEFCCCVDRDGKPWEPKPHHRICSDHFVDGAVTRVYDPSYPNYVPTLNPPPPSSNSSPKHSAIKRKSRAKSDALLRRKIRAPARVSTTTGLEAGKSVSSFAGNSCSTDQLSPNFQIKEEPESSEQELGHMPFTTEIELPSCSPSPPEQLEFVAFQHHFNKPSFKEEAVQTTSLYSWPQLKQHRGKMITFSCDFKSFNTVIGRNGGAIQVVIKHEAALQVEHEPESEVATVKKRDASSSPDPKSIYFGGYQSIQLQRGHLKEMTSIPEDVFNTLLNQLHDFQPSVFKVEDLLLIFLIKLKHDLPFTVLEVVFQCKHTTLIRYFYKMLDHLYIKTQQMIAWPTGEDNRQYDGLANCFKGDLSNCVAVIECCEISSAKKSGSFKYLIGITPKGRICYLSNLFDVSNSTNLAAYATELEHLLAPGKVVLVDAVFANTCHSDSIVVMPFKAKQNLDGPGPQLNPDNQTTTDTRKFGFVRMFTELVLCRWRVYKILNKRFDAKMIAQAGKIIHMCAVLVNYQPPIKKPKMRKGEIDYEPTLPEIITVSDFESD